MKDFARQPGETTATSLMIAQPVSERVPKTLKLAATFELLLAVLLGFGSFPYIPFGNTVGLLLLGSASLWLRGTGWRAIGLQRPRSWLDFSVTESEPQTAGGSLAFSESSSHSATTTQQIGNDWNECEDMVTQ